MRSVVATLAAATAPVFGRSGKQLELSAGATRPLPMCSLCVLGVALTATSLATVAVDVNASPRLRVLRTVTAPALSVGASVYVG